MDIWKYYYITHKKHKICNPMSENKLNKLLSLLDLNSKSRVLDIACGKGEFLIRLAELYDISGVGVDISPFFIRECNEKKNNRVPDSDIEILEMDGIKYLPKRNEFFDLTLCIGASFVYDGFIRTIDALKDMTKQNGFIIIGEPFWQEKPNDKYLEMSGIKKEDFNTHLKNIDTGEKKGLNCLYTLVSNHDDWDHYETLQWWSTNNYVTSNPDDPDNPELLSNMEKAKKEYLLYGKDTLGWAIYIFKKI